MEDKWNLEKAPSKAQKVLAILLSIIGLLVCGAFALGITWMAVDTGRYGENLPAAGFLLLLFVACAYVLYRSMFGKPTSMSRSGRLGVGVFVSFLSVLLLGAAVFGHLEVEKMLFSVAIALAGLSRAIHLIYRNLSPER